MSEPFTIVNSQPEMVEQLAAIQRACFPPWPPPSASLRHITRRIYNASRQDSLPCLKPSLVVWWLAPQIFAPAPWIFPMSSIGISMPSIKLARTSRPGWRMAIRGGYRCYRHIANAVWHDGYTRRARPWCAASASGHVAGAATRISAV